MHDHSIYMYEIISISNAQPVTHQYICFQNMSTRCDTKMLGRTWTTVICGLYLAMPFILQYYISLTTVTGYTFPHQQIIIIIIIVVISIITITHIFNWRSSTLHFMYLYQLTVTTMTTKEQFQTSMSHDSAYPTGWRGTNTLHVTMTSAPYHQNVQSSLWCQNPKFKMNSYKNNTSTLSSGMWHHI